MVTSSSSSAVLARATSLLALALACCYGVGALVVNRELARFGYFSFSLFRASYVGAGLWALVLPVFAAAVLGAAARVIPEDSSASPGPFARRLRSSSVRAGLLAIAAVGAAVAVISLEIVAGVTPSNAIYAVLPMSIAALTASACWRAFIRPTNSHVSVLRLRLWTLASVAVLPMAAWAYLSYASAIWSEVPMSLGGGRPRVISLYVDSMRVSRAQLGSVALAPDSLWRVQAALVLRTEAAFVVAPFGRKTAVELPFPVVRFAGYARRTQRGSVRELRVADWLERFGATFYDPDSAFDQRL